MSEKITLEVRNMPSEEGWYWLKIGESFQWLVAWIDDGRVYICGLSGPEKADTFMQKFPSAIWGEKLTPPTEPE